MNIAERVEELMSALYGGGVDSSGIHRALRVVATAVAQLEAREPRWYEITGRETSMMFPDGFEVRYIVLVIGGMCVPGGEAWDEKLKLCEQRKLCSARVGVAVKDLFFALWAIGAMLTAFDTGVVAKRWCPPKSTGISRLFSSVGTGVGVVAFASTWPALWLALLWGRWSVRRRVRKAGGL
jgi:hypothetical protein